MKPYETSFGCQLVLWTRPDLAFDIEQLPEPLVLKGSLDQIALELELMRSGNALEIRTKALAAFAKTLLERYNNAEKGIEFIVDRDHDMGVWAACVCARDALQWIPESKPLARQVLDTLDLWLQGLVSEKEVLDVREEMRERDQAGARGRVLSAFIAVSDASYSVKKNRLEYATGAAAAATSAAADTLVNYSDPRRRDESRRIVGVIADALPGMSVRVR